MSVDQKEISKLWQTVLDEFQKELSAPNFKTWFLPVLLEDIDADGVASIVTPNSFISNNLDKRYKERILVLLNNSMSVGNLGEVTEIKFSTSASRRGAPRKDSIKLKGPVEKTPYRPKDPRSRVLPINPKYTFDNFVVGSSNELAYTVAQAVANDPGQRFNPLFIYGGVGLGKTHLIQAIANHILEGSPNKKVIYSSTQSYVADFLESIRNKTTPQFSKLYAEADVLVIDDIQFIAGKDKTMEDFFHTFNLLHQSNKQIIISADQPPRTIPTLPDRLRSRFEWGMTIDIQSPDFETRCAIIQTKAALQGISIEYEVVEFIASSITSNIRELEGVINHIIVRCQVQNIEPNLSFVKEVVQASNSTSKQFNARTVIETCSEYFGIDQSDILSARRDKEIVITRQVAMYLMRTELKMSLPRISGAVNRKDHTTAIHSIRKIEEGLKNDLTLKRNVNNIRQKLYE